MKCRINRGKTAGETGTVKWIGQLPDAPHDDFIGIELDAPSEFSYKRNTIRDKDCRSKIFQTHIFHQLNMVNFVGFLQNFCPLRVGVSCHVYSLDMSFHFFSGFHFYFV